MEAEAAVAPQSKIRKFYVFDPRALINAESRVINPQLLMPIIETIVKEEDLHWALTSTTPKYLQDDAYHALVAAHQGHFNKRPVNVLFDGKQTLLNSAVAINDINTHLDGDEPARSIPETAKFVFGLLLDAQLEAEKNAAAGEPVSLLDKVVQSKVNTTTVTYNERTTITLQFGETRITFHLHILLQNMADFAKSGYQLFFIFQALDAAKLRLTATSGVTNITTPADYTNIDAKDVVFMDDQEDNCKLMEAVGFTVIRAKTELTHAALENTLPADILFRKTLSGKTYNERTLKDATSESIALDRSTVLSLLTRMVKGKNDLSTLKDLPQLAPLFTFKEIRFSPFQKSVDPIRATPELLALANAYVLNGQYNEALSQFLVKTLAADWKNVEARQCMREVANLRVEKNADISPALFGLAHTGSYNAKFFTNPRSRMHKLVNGKIAGFETLTMEQIRAGATEGSRTKEVLEVLGATKGPAPK